MGSCFTKTAMLSSFHLTWISWCYMLLSWLSLYLFFQIRFSVLPAYCCDKEALEKVFAEDTNLRVRCLVRNARVHHLSSKSYSFFPATLSLTMQGIPVASFERWTDCLSAIIFILFEVDKLSNVELKSLKLEKMEFCDVSAINI